MMAREEPLLKQLVRSRALQPRDQSLSPTGRNNFNWQPRSASQPAPMQRMPFRPQPQQHSPPTMYTLKLMPCALVYNNTNNSGSAPIHISMSQPDLTQLAPPPSPPTISRSHSPVPMVSTAASPNVPVPSPSAERSRSTTPINSRQLSQAQQPDIVSSIYGSPPQSAVPEMYSVRGDSGLLVNSNVAGLATVMRQPQYHPIPQQQQQQQLNGVQCGALQGNSDRNKAAASPDVTAAAAADLAAPAAMMSGGGFLSRPPSVERSSPSAQRPNFGAGGWVKPEELKNG